jgi:predicted amidohydrolase
MKILIWITLLFCLANFSAVAGPRVKVAAVHFGPVEGDVKANLPRLVGLAEEAARHAAKIVVHTEMATSGYSFFSREQIASVAEALPGPSTRALGVIARRYRIYVAVGLPEHDASTGMYYNSVALVGPQGDVIGVYRKRNNLIDASYNSEVWSGVPTFDTPYGKSQSSFAPICFTVCFPGKLHWLASTSCLRPPTSK